MTPEYIKAEAIAERLGAALMAIIAESANGCVYVAPNDKHTQAAKVHKPEDYLSQELPCDSGNIWCPIYGFDSFDKLFTNRQLNALSTLSKLVEDWQQVFRKRLSLDHRTWAKELVGVASFYPPLVRIGLLLPLYSIKLLKTKRFPIISALCGQFTVAEFFFITLR